METNTMKKKKTLACYVGDWIEDQASEYDSGKKGVYEDLFHGGCESGYVGDLIYYSDTTAFYAMYKEEINSMLYELVQDTGMEPAELFGDKWDKEDPLCLEQYNQNLLAWFGFEEMARKLAQQEGYDF